MVSKKPSPNRKERLSLRISEFSARCPSSQKISFFCMNEDSKTNGNLAFNQLITIIDKINNLMLVIIHPVFLGMFGVMEKSAFPLNEDIFF